MELKEAAILVETTIREQMPDIFPRVGISMGKSGNNIKVNIASIGGIAHFIKLENIFTPMGWKFSEYSCMPTGELVEVGGKNVLERGFSCSMIYTWGNAKKNGSPANKNQTKI